MNCICHSIDNSLFNSILPKELKIPITIENVINESHCVSININKDETVEHSLEASGILSVFKGKMGIYHLWIDQEYCGDHFDHKMLCVYVGKGYVQNRIKSHLETKWPQDETIYISFFECQNRIAKYLEQLFLDTYEFHLNKEENFGEMYLHTMWDENRVVNGTELHAQAEILARKYPDAFNPPN